MCAAPVTDFASHVAVTVCRSFALPDMAAPVAAAPVSPPFVGLRCPPVVPAEFVEPLLDGMPSCTVVQKRGPVHGQESIHQHEDGFFFCFECSHGNRLISFAMLGQQAKLEFMFHANPLLADGLYPIALQFERPADGTALYHDVQYSLNVLSALFFEAKRESRAFQWYQKQHHRVKLMIRNNEPAGFYYYDCEGDVPQLQVIYVRPQHRRVGLATRMLEDFERDHAGQTVGVYAPCAQMKDVMRNAGWISSEKTIAANP